MTGAFHGFTKLREDRRKFILGALFCSAAGLAAWRHPHKTINFLGRRKLETVIPKSIGPWNFVTASGLVVPPEDQFSKTIYAQILTRVYSDGQSPPIMLLMAESGSQTGFLQIHRPETCYTAGGYQISALTPHAIPVGIKTVGANALEASLNGQVEHIIYWTRVGNRIPASWRDQKLAVAELNLQGFVPDAILVRISSVSADVAATRATIDKFVATLIELLSPADKAVLIGR